MFPTFLRLRKFGITADDWLITDRKYDGADQLCAGRASVLLATGDEILLKTRPRELWLVA